MIRNAKVSLHPGGGRVEVDDVVLTGVRRAVIEGAAGEIPQLTLELISHEAEIDGQMRVTIPPKTAVTLAALGWTAPDDQPLDSPGQQYAWLHGCGTLNDGTPEDSGCCAGCRRDPDAHDRETSPRYVLVQVGGRADAASG